MALTLCFYAASMLAPNFIEKWATNS